MFRNIKIIITFVFFLLSSHLYANCSKDDINYYLEKGFSHDQVTKLCSSESKSRKIIITYRLKMNTLIPKMQSIKSE